MSSQRLETTDETPSTARSNTERALSMLSARSQDGSLAMLAGSATLASALASLRTRRGRATVLALAGAGLVGFGVRQRRGGGGGSGDDVETGADARRDDDGEKRVSDDAHIEAGGNLGADRTADESAGRSVSETAESDLNPRGMTDRSDLEDEPEGDPRFVDGKESGRYRETHLEDETAHDPRLHPENDDEPTEIDLSEVSMADEASEATGPHPEQAYPAREGTDPEPTSEKAPERTGSGAVAPADSSDRESEPDDEGELSEDEDSRED